MLNPKTATFKSCTLDHRFIKLSEENKKLKPTKAVKFLIFNIPSKVTCPYSTALCREFCYAVKSEVAYPSVLPSRVRNLNRTKTDNFITDMIFSITAYLNKPSYKTAKKIVVRIHESGDFYNYIYLQKWYTIANYFKHDKRVVFMAYTKSVRYIHLLALKKSFKPDNFIIRYSVWDDTAVDDIALAESYNLPIYTAVPTFDKSIPSQNRCRCNDCATCGKCWTKTKRIICEIH